MNAQKQAFPTLPAKSLKNRLITFPDDLNGQKAFLVLVFEDFGRFRNAQAQADLWAASWAKHLESQDVVFYEVPMLSSGWNIMKGFIDGSMRSGIPAEKHDNVACFYGNKGAYIKKLDIDPLSQAHVFLLNEAGEIVFRAKGKPAAGDVADMLAILAGGKPEEK